MKVKLSFQTQIYGQINKQTNDCINRWLIHYLLGNVCPNAWSYFMSKGHEHRLVILENLNFHLTSAVPYQKGRRRSYVQESHTQ